MIINHNMMADNAHRFMGVNSSGMGKNVEKLSSGMKINRAADDAAGLFISEKMRSQVRGLNQASQNSLDGISAVQTAEGALDEVHAMLQRMRELAVKAGNTTLQSSDVQAIQDEISQLTSEIDQVAKTTQFNKTTLLNGDFKNKMLQVGANAGQTLALSISAMTAKGLGLSGTSIKVGAGEAKKITAASNKAATTVLKAVDKAIASVSKQRSSLGAIQNRLEHKIRNLDNAAENTQTAESRIRDTDMAKTMSKFTKDNILTQASQAMLAQANQLPQQVLQLLR
ncbi:flagellin N-terminal helical domain-containing protein [Criibacterium bergeronii]|uniref:Flagellin n=1 Tax=Criibacterium bergeronii TaxID=1871336 RepID=A0A371IKA3_9FIRM|nr:flagellin [Criibacterium bergeronii]MBS6062856.1 flagellin [Peptostreptococcaceae bacterium]RDY20894.1 flagellin [Criibacterium bergeronii]